MAFVNHVLNLQTTKLDAFAGFTDVRHGLGRRFISPGTGWLFSARVSSARVTTSAGEP